MPGRGGGEESIPCDMVGEDATQQRPHHGRHTIYAPPHRQLHIFVPIRGTSPTDRADKPLIDRPLGQRDKIHHNDNRAGEDTGVAQAREGAADDKGNGAGRCAADGGAELEEADGG